MKETAPFRNFLSLGLALVFTAASTYLPAQNSVGVVGPVELRVDNLPNPLGIDDPAPKFSWRLHDPARGAKQTAYEVDVASNADSLKAGNPDIWTSGRVDGAQSLNVKYSGPALKPSTRYFWRVTVWGANGKADAPSAASLWETGLMSESSWTAAWIGYETPEEATVRNATADWIASPDAATLATERGKEQRFAYRTIINLTKPVKFAALYATGQETAAAWVNGAPVMEEVPLPPYGHTPWKKFVRADVTAKLIEGANTLAIETLHYLDNPDGAVEATAPPTIATLVVEYADGAWASFGTDATWKSAIHAASGWTGKQFDDSGWKPAAVVPDGAEANGHPWIPDSVKDLRQSFTVNKPVKSARLYATALGAYEMFLNGQRVGDQLLAPGWTDYRERVYYQTYDVTSQIAVGENAIGGLLAPGWYETPLEWLQQPNNYGVTPPALRAQLRIEYTDGSVEWVATDASWLAEPSYILHSEIYDGETQDARFPDQGWNMHWNMPEFAATGWSPATTIDPAPMKIEAQDFPPIRAVRPIEARSPTQPKPGVFVYDFGQNFSGQEWLRVTGPAGTDVRLRFAEILNPDGTIYTDNLRTAKATDHFILRGAQTGHGIEDFTPQFTFHGFRYAELTGFPGKPDINSVKANVIHTDAPFTAHLETGSPLINQLWSNILWGQRSNFVGVPTDCPQRDERLGWMGDAEVFWRAASYNMDLAAFSRKFAGDMRGTQFNTPYYGIYSPGTVHPNMGHAAGWSDAGIIIPWTAWLDSGDTSIIDQNWAAMTRYLDAIEAGNSDGLWKNDSGIAFGDWLSPEGKTNYLLIATAYWAYDVTLMREMAQATGRTAEAEKYAALFDKIRAAFDKQFVSDDGFVAGADNSASEFGQINNPDAKSKGGDTQTGYVLALHMNLVPENLRAAAARKLVDKIQANHSLLGTGFLGTPYLLEELTKAGYSDLAYTLLLNTQYPSWGYMVTHGATTMWERWNGDQMRGDPSMNSYNHYAYGAVADWIYRYAAGVDASPLDAGFHTVVLHPVFDPRLGHVSFDYDSSYGRIHSDWKLVGATALWHVTIPANTTGWLPLTAAEQSKYKLSGTPIQAGGELKPESRNGESGLVLPSGSYTFNVDLK
ncbi:MAG: family 78 glycoside hydrolase catalytic domain [Terracidiphilus sp.]